MVKTRLLCFCLSIFMLMPAFAAAGENAPADVTGKWQISWEARMGTEHAKLQLEQSEAKLTGTFQGRLGAPKVSGAVEGKNIRLNLDFPGAHPFTLIFTGTIDGDKMAGKFDIQGVEGGYDWHGENVHPSNYAWTAVRQPDQTQSHNSGNQSSHQ